MKNKDMDSKNTILLAEDDKFISRAYNDGLKRAGFDVIVALDGAQAIEAMKKQKPDIILLDLIMPVKNGFEVLEELRLNKELKNIPVIILSNLGQEADIEKGKELGAVDYLVKTNFSLTQVIERVRYHLARGATGKKEKTEKEKTKPSTPKP